MPLLQATAALLYLGRVAWVPQTSSGESRDASIAMPASEATATALNEVLRRYGAQQQDIGYLQTYVGTWRIDLTARLPAEGAS